MDTNNKIIHMPLILKPCGKGIIIHRTDQYTMKRYGQIVLPQGKDQYAERKYDVGEVLAIGRDVEEVEVGDIVLWQVSTGFRIPNGVNSSRCWKVEEFPMSIVAILPNLDMAKRSSKWDGLDERSLDEYHKMLANYLEEDKEENAPRFPADIKIPAVGRGEIENPDFSMVGVGDDD